MATNVGDFFKTFWVTLTEGFSKICESIGGFFGNLGESLGNWFQNVGNWFGDLGKNIVDGFGDVLNWFGNFFIALGDFFIHIFVPTDTQWSEIQQDYANMGDKIKNKIPFVSLFSEELKKAQSSVSRSDFLVITVPSFDFSTNSGIHVSSGEQKTINVSEKYEPYREYVRGALFLVVIGCAFVYVLKYVLRFGQTQAAEKVRNER